MERVKPIQFGVIGTNWITEAFIEAASMVPGFKLTAVYSRSEEKGKEFASKFEDAQVFTDIDKMAISPAVNAVYIASPNSFHAEHASIVMKRGKHVLCEKPMASNANEVENMIGIAKERKVVLMEGIKSICQPNFSVIFNNIHKIGKVRRYFSSYCQYSSRYDAYKNGTILNAFNPEFSNGSIMDIGIYGIYPAVTLFGEPLDVLATGVMLESGVDGQGSLLLKYEELECVIIHSKISNSYIPSEIQGEEGSLIIDNINDPRDIVLRYKDGTEETLHSPQEYPAMYYEAKEFMNTITNGETESSVNSLQSSLITARIIERAREQVGINFPADSI